MVGLSFLWGQEPTKYPLLQDFKTPYRYFQGKKKGEILVKISQFALLMLGPLGLGFGLGLATAGYF